jgi:hypothetical protein
VTTAAPAGVVPAPAKRAPRSFRSVSAKKLSDEGSINANSWATVGDCTRASGIAPAGVRAARLRPWIATPSAFSAAHSRRAA